MTWRDAQPELAPGWVWTTLGEVADADLGKMLDRKKQTGEHKMEYLRNVNVRWHELDLGDLLTMDVAPHELDRYTVRAGDLLVCEGGEPGRAAIVPKAASGLAYQKALHRLRPADGIDVRYLAYAFDAMASQGHLSGHTTGSTIKHLPREQLVGLWLPLAPEAEQIRIADELDAQMSRLDAMLVALRLLVGPITLSKESRLGRMRALLLRQAFAGALVGQNAADEPAGSLLERVSAARAGRALRPRRRNNATRGPKVASA